MSNDMNVCKNWVLRCNTMKKTENGVMLKCAKSGRKREDGTYAPTMWIDVVCGANTDMERENWEKKYILVDGSFSIGEWNRNGENVLAFTIFATKVTEKVYEQRQ